MLHSIRCPQTIILKIESYIILLTEVLLLAEVLQILLQFLTCNVDTALYCTQRQA